MFSTNKKRHSNLGILKQMPSKQKMSKHKSSKINQNSGGVKRNIILTDQELESKNKAAKNKHTENQNKCADKAFRNFLIKAGCESTEYWLYEEPELDTHLEKFWHGVRKTGLAE